MAELAARYDAILFDAYGVLLHQGGALEGARDVLLDLRAAERAYFIVTNDASRLPTTTAARLQSFGLPVEPDQIVTSGVLIAPYFAEHNLAGAHCMVLGPDDSRAYVEQAGGVVVPPDETARYDAVVVCDDAGYPFLKTLDIALTAMVRHIDRGDRLELILPNPDLIYPKGEHAFGFTSGAVAMVLEAALQRRYGDGAPRFARLGKPHAPIFAEARRRAGSHHLVMIGDQLETDIAGARAFGFDAALLATGISRRDATPEEPALRPTYLLRSLSSTSRMTRVK